MGKLKKHFTKQELEEINSKHYFPLIWRGAGNTRDVFKALFKKNGLEKIVAFKITKKEIGENSPCTEINQSKVSNPNEHEIDYFKYYDDHPNIASIRDVLIINNRHATVEDWMDGVTLKEYVESRGPLSRYGALKTAAATLRAMAYMHHKYPVPLIHRDIKPSNMMNDSELYPKITDLQNAKRASHIVKQLLPTRGGTKYTHVRMLDDFVNQIESQCDISTDIYAWGASMYFGLVGRAPFNYKMVYDPEGTRVDLGHKIIHASITLDGVAKKGIDRDEHNAKLFEKVKLAPEEWRPILFDSMHWDDKEYNVKNIVRYVADIDLEKRYRESWDSISRFLKNGSF
jgi:serine/threonine protein kinase